ncbi:hypothetical protein FSP39_002998 [Pinctada imbricata]|uniref:Uncharacterized protein n=1 Tax=Pinctada imbricata TaxID=66713 RepID=A0AA88Y8S0_PINIB|nr:hypothetical protein FSP39_002998 [Pinctada imbricata]
MGKRKGKAPKKPRAKETEIIQSENKLIENYNENICRALQTAIVAATEQYSPSLMGMMYGDIIPAAVWKMMVETLYNYFLCDRMTTDEERCTCLCLLTDYLSKECSSLGMLDSNSTATSLLGPTNNVLKTLSTMWNNALLKYQSKDLYGNLFTQLSSNLQKSVKMFTLYGFQDYFIQPLKLLKEIEEGSVVISVRSDIPTIPNHSRINCQKLRTILYKAYSPRKDPYDDYFQESHYKNNVWYKRRMSMLNGCDSDPEYIPDDSFHE